ncbi:MAG: pseudouridylate synthase [Prevotella sp.]|nr:pseudouridylate synthase [Prevotella sp.]
MNEDPRHPTPQFLRAIGIHELLPQQEPFVVIDHLVSFTMERTVTETTLRADNLFMEAGALNASGLVENIAQTCAARIGYINKYILKKGIQLGFIAAVRDMTIHATPLVGDTIETSIDIVAEVMGMILATGTVTCGDKTLVTTNIKIAVKEGG